MSATSGIEIFSLIAGISRTASISGIAARRISQPAFSSATACRTLPSISLDGTFSIDCTVTGAPPPILTFPAVTCFEIRFISLSFPGSPVPPLPRAQPAEAAPRIS